MRWSAHVHSSPSPRKYDKYCLATATAAGFVAHEHVDDAVRDLHIDRADRGRFVGPETTALDHRRATHADVRTFGRDDHVATTEQRRISGEAVAAGDADQGNEAAELGEQVEREDVEPGDGGAVGVAGATTAAFGEEDDGQLHAARRVRTAGLSSRGSTCPASPRARCSRTTSRRPAVRSRCRRRRRVRRRACVR